MMPCLECGRLNCPVPVTDTPSADTEDRVRVTLTYIDEDAGVYAFAIVSD